MADEDWSEYRRLVLAELKRLTERIDALTERIGHLESGMAVMQFKAGVLGALAGAIPGAVAVMWVLLK